MVYTTEYASPLGPITLACDGEAIIGLWFNGQRYFGNILPEQTEKKEHPLVADAKRWLDVYFSGREPDFLPPLRYDSTPFRRLICEIMLTIPYGKTMTYGQIAAEAAKRLGAEKMSAQAVGGTVGHNPISLMIPCHRVVGTSGSLTGYGGGIARKVKLLELEHADMRGLFVPKTGAAIQKMIEFYKGNRHDVNHFLKVWAMAKTIGELEGLDRHTQEVLELAAVIHDIACPLCREKYGDTDGKHQELESPALVEAFFTELPAARPDVDRISWLAAHHHTYTDIGGIDHQILLEADYLVNADEQGHSRSAIENFRRRVFRTASGTHLLDSIYLQG